MLLISIAMFHFTATDTTAEHIARFFWSDIILISSRAMLCVFFSVAFAGS